MPEGHSHFRFPLLVLGVAVVSVMAGALLWRATQAPMNPENPTILLLPEPKSFDDFTLVDHRGQPFTRKDFEGRWSVLFFGFTSCPDICPNTLFQFGIARQRLLEKFDPAELPRFYLVSVDPERDTPGKLADYLAYFDPEFIGISGADSELRTLSMELGIAYHVAPHEPGAGDYTVDHSASVLLLNPSAQLAGVLPAPVDGAQMARDLQSLMP